MQVITEKTIFDGDIIGVSSFGIHNAFSHVILRRNKKIKNYSKCIKTECKIPRLVFVSGRNEENVRQSMVKVIIIEVSKFIKPFIQIIRMT